MTIATIIALSIGLILIIISFVMTGKDTEAEAEEKTTPGLREELTEADKKQLRKLTDNFIREYSKKQVKDSVKSTVDTRVQEAVSSKQSVINEKVSEIDKKLSEIDAHAEAGVKTLKDEANAISAGWDKNRTEVESVYQKITETEKEVKLQLNLIDEYKKGLEKLKDEADSSVDRLQQVQAAGTVAVAAEDAAEAAVEETAEETVEEEAEAAVEAVAEETAEAAVEEEAEAADEAADAEDEEDDEPEEDEEESEDEEDDESEDEEDEEEDESDDKEDDEEDESEDEEEEESDDEEDDEEDESDDEEDDEEDESDDEEDESEEEDDGEPADEDLEDVSGVVLPFVPGNVAESVIEDATKETLNHETADTEDDLDEFDEDFDDEEDDLKAITNLDQILDREGIDLNAEDPTLNILTMYGAGLSIIEISKVLKMGVGEVKYIIDSNTSN